jgi:lysophospholipase L1-like esterase
MYRGGWRVPAFSAMTAAGQAPNFIGGLTNASETPPVTGAGTGHNGNNGSSSAQWVSSFYATYQPGLSATPHIITIATGANDADTVGGGQDVGALIDLAAASYPLAAILVGTRTQATGGAGATHAAQVRTEVANRRQNGMHVTLVDQWAAFGSYTHRYLGDGLHFTPAGYAVLGELWGRYMTALAAGLKAA